MTEQELATQLRKSEQKNGELRHKLKQRKNDKDDFNDQIGKLRKENSSVRSDLILAYKNLDKMARDLIALKRVFSLLQMTGEEENRIKAMIKN